MTEQAGVPGVVVPSSCGAARLPSLLDSLRRQTVDHEVVVVDNGSSDATPELLRERYPEVRVIALAENVGFGRAVNRGVAACSGSTIVLVNDDATCRPDFLEALCGRLDAPRATVMAAGILLDGDDPSRIDTAGVMFDSTLLAFDYLHGRPVAALGERTPSPLGPTGGAAAFDRAAFEAVGGFDERIFAYLEDVDLVARIMARGGRCALAPDARAVHRHSATLGAGSRRKAALMGWSRGYTIGKYRLHRRPRRFARAALGEVALASAQLLYDRTAIGFRARAAGFRAGLATSAHGLDWLPDEVERVSARYVLGERLRAGRRRRNAFRTTDATNLVPIPK